MSKIISFVALILSIISMSLSVYTNRQAEQLKSDYEKAATKIKSLNEQIEILNHRSIFDDVSSKTGEIGAKISDSLNDLSETAKKGTAKAFKELAEKLEGKE